MRRWFASLWFRLVARFKRKDVCGCCGNHQSDLTFGAVWMSCRRCYLPCCPWCSMQGTREARVHIPCGAKP